MLPPLFVLIKAVAIAALAAAITVAVIVYSMPMRANPNAPNVRFTEFTPDRMDIKVGQATKIVFNVQNLESHTINNSRVVTVIEPSSYAPFLSIDKPSIELPVLPNKDSRTGQIEVTITANSAPAKEALFTVKGVLYAEGVQSDVREFDLRVRQ